MLFKPYFVTPVLSMYPMFMVSVDCIDEASPALRRFFGAMAGATMLRYSGESEGHNADVGKQQKEHATKGHVSANTKADRRGDSGQVVW